MSQILQDARTLWELSFPTDSAEFLDFYFSRVAKAENTYIEYNEAGEAIAHIGIQRYGHGIDEDLKLAYVAGACTRPEARGKGIMQALMHRVITIERGKGTSALILIPADEGLRKYYNKHFGFCNAATRSRLSLNAYLELLKQEEPRSYSATSAESLLCQAMHGHSHISYSLETARAVLDEYRIMEGASCLTIKEEGLYKGLILLRQDNEKSYIDALIGDSKVLSTWLEEHHDMQAEVSYIFNKRKDIKQEPWGMYLPLAERINTSLDQLAISLAHN